jgi:hypothetical protein
MQMNLGNALASLAERQSSPAHMEEALACVRRVSEMEAELVKLKR